MPEALAGIFDGLLIKTFVENEKFKGIKISKAQKNHIPIVYLRSYLVFRPANLK